MDRRHLLLGLLLMLMSALMPAAQAGVYKWVDEQGHVHYGERPHGSQAEEMKIRSDPGGSSHKADPGSALERQQHLLQSYELERRTEKAQRDKAAAAEAEKKTKCLQARDRLKTYEEAHYMYRLDDKGERHVLSDAERAKETAQLRADIKQYCS